MQGSQAPASSIRREDNGKGTIMLTLVPIILICASDVAPQDCSEAVSIIKLVAPTDENVGGLVGCTRFGMLYAASSHLVTAGTYPKIICTPPERLGRYLDESRELTFAQPGGPEAN
jgi:hypothetical protein